MNIKKHKIKVRVAYPQEKQEFRLLSLEEYFEHIFIVLSEIFPESSLTISDDILKYNLAKQGLKHSDIILSLMPAYNAYVERIEDGCLKECSLSISCIEVLQHLERALGYLYSSIGESPFKKGGIILC